MMLRLLNSVSADRFDRHAKNSARRTNRLLDSRAKKHREEPAMLSELRALLEQWNACGRSFNPSTAMGAPRSPGGDGISGPDSILRGPREILRPYDGARAKVRLGRTAMPMVVAGRREDNRILKKFP